MTALALTRHTGNRVIITRGDGPPAVLAIYAPMIYTAPCVMLLMRAASIMRASGKGLGPGNQDFFGPCEKGIEPIVYIIMN
jgi:hypothetical protein